MSYIGIDRPPVEQSSPDVPVLDEVRANTFKGTVLRDFQLQGFFHESVSPKLLSGPYVIFRGLGKMVHERNLKQKIS
jgi:hypothetical protein